jgi:thioester reductase-like protein
MNLFLTGATGFLGTALLARIGTDPMYQRIYVLIRGGKHGSAQSRLSALLKNIFPAGELEVLSDKFVAVEGDLTLDNLGLTAADHFMLQTTVNQIVHIGASTDFGAPLDESRRYNVKGTKRVIDLALLCRNVGGLKRLDYVSTAFVAGIKSGIVDENTIIRGQSFANNYERSKYEAEVMVRSFGDRLPITIYRPSIVVGDSRNGYTPHFKVLYWPLKLLSKRLLRLIPTNLRAKLDVVPVDFVADSIALLMKQEEATGECFHLTAGLNNEVEMDTVLEDAMRFAGVPRVPVIPLWIFDLIRFTPLKLILSKDFWETCKLASPYYYYLKGGGPRFNADATHQKLKRYGITIKNWRDYREPVLSYCKTSGWGKKNRVPSPCNFFPSHSSATGG